MSASFFATLCLLATATCSPLRQADRGGKARRTLLSPANDAHCEFDFKVYVYPLAESAPALPSVRLPVEARRNGSYHVCVGCIYEQFALEYVVLDFFSNFCGRTYDPHEADFFYLPLVRDIEFRIQKLSNNNKKPTMTEIALLQALEKNNTKLWRQLFNVTDRWWHRHNGADHLIVMPAPVTNLRHESSRRGFFHYMPHLHRPVFLNIEYSKSFVAEYPMCAQYKNIVMPYPSLDPAIINGQHAQKHSHKHASNNSNTGPNKLDATSNSANPPSRYGRSLLLFYHGGNHGECMAVRQALVQVMKGNDLLDSKGASRKKLKYKTGYLNSVFCPVPVGDSPSSKRMYDAIAVGCIPVVLSDDLLWAYSPATGGVSPVQPHLFSISMPQRVVQTTVLQLYQNAVLGSGGGRSGGDEEVEEERLQGGEDMRRGSEGGDSARDILEVLGKTFLPASGLSLRHLVDVAIAEASGTHANSGSGEGITMSTNALVAILRLVPPQDVASLQDQVRRVAAPAYRYYAPNASQLANPLKSGVLPNGGAITRMASQLSSLKRRGILTIGQKCQEERAMKHNYIGNYPCDNVGGDKERKGGKKAAKKMKKQGQKKKKQKQQRIRR